MGVAEERRVEEEEREEEVVCHFEEPAAAVGVSEESVVEDCSFSVASTAAGASIFSPRTFRS